MSDDRGSQYAMVDAIGKAIRSVFTSPEFSHMSGVCGVMALHSWAGTVSEQTGVDYLKMLAVSVRTEGFTEEQAMRAVKDAYAAETPSWS